MDTFIRQQFVDYWAERKQNTFSQQSFIHMHYVTRDCNIYESKFVTFFPL